MRVDVLPRAGGALRLLGPEGDREGGVAAVVEVGDGGAVAGGAVHDEAAVGGGGADQGDGLRVGAWPRGGAVRQAQNSPGCDGRLAVAWGERHNKTLFESLQL